MITDDELHQAWDRIARTADGRTIYLHLQRRLMAVCAAADDSTLREDSGERKFAAKLIGLMAKGIEESGGSSDSIITFAVAGGHAVSRSRGAGRRISESDRIPGWDTDTDAEPGAGR